MSSTNALSVRSMRPFATAADRVARFAPLSGAVLVMVGVVLPWLTLFAGLQSYTGLAGRNGRLVLVSGAVAAGLAVFALRRPRPSLRNAIATLGAMLGGYSAWLLVGVLTMVGREAANPMLLARVGPGLFVVAAGAILLMCASLPVSKSVTSP